MQRNTQRSIISENSTHKFLKPLNEFLNGYSEKKTVVFVIKYVFECVKDI